MKVRVRAEGIKVLFAIDGQRFLEVEWQNALELSRMLLSAAKVAEERAMAERIIADSALLVRAGAGLVLSNNARIVDAALNEAAWNTDLRRAIPGIKSTTVFGVPAIVQSQQRTEHGQAEG